MLERFKSKKFILAIATAIVFALQGQYNQAALVVMTYLGIQGYIDGKPSA